MKEKKHFLLNQKPNHLLVAVLFLALILITIILFFGKKLFYPKEPLPVNSLILSTPTPEGADFFTFDNLEEAILNLNSPQKLIEYLNRFFILENKESDLSQPPEEFLKTKKGNITDIVTFSSLVLCRNAYFGRILRYLYIDKEGNEGIRTFTVFAENNQNKIIDLENSKLKILPIESITLFLKSEEKNREIKIKKFAVLPCGTSDFSNIDWLRWVLRHE